MSRGQGENASGPDGWVDDVLPQSMLSCRFEECVAAAQKAVYTAAV
jgi:hypothetical protein